MMLPQNGLGLASEINCAQYLNFKFMKLQLLIRSLNLKVIEGDDKSKFIERDFSNINTEKEYRELEEV